MASIRCRVSQRLRAQMAAVHKALGQPEPFQLLYAWAPPAPAPARGADPLAPPSTAHTESARRSASTDVGKAVTNPGTGVPAPSRGSRAGAELELRPGPGPRSGAALSEHVAQADKGLGSGLWSWPGPGAHPGAQAGSPVHMSLLQRWAAKAVASGGGCSGGRGGARREEAKTGARAEPGAVKNGQPAELGAGLELTASGRMGEAWGCSGLTNLPDIELELDLGLSSPDPVRPCGSQPCAAGCGAHPASALECEQPCAGAASAAGPCTAEPIGLAAALAPVGQRVLAEAGARRGNAGSEPGTGSGSEAGGSHARRTLRGRENQAPAAPGSGAPGAARVSKGLGLGKEALGMHGAQRAAQPKEPSVPVASRVGTGPAAGVHQGMDRAPAALNAATTPAARPASGGARWHTEMKQAAQPGAHVPQLHMGRSVGVPGQQAPSCAAVAASCEAGGGLPSAPSSPTIGLALMFGCGASPPGWACSLPGWDIGSGLCSPGQCASPVYTLAAEQLSAAAACGVADNGPDLDPQASAQALPAALLACGPVRGDARPAGAAVRGNNWAAQSAEHPGDPERPTSGAPAVTCACSAPAGAAPGATGEAAQATQGPRNPEGPVGGVKRSRPAKRRTLEALRAGNGHANPGAQGVPTKGKKKKRKGAPAGTAAPGQPAAQGDCEPAAHAGAAGNRSGGDGGDKAGCHGLASCPPPKAVTECSLAAEQAAATAGASTLAEPGSCSGSRGANANPAALEALRGRAAAAAAAAEAAAREYAEALACGACAGSSLESGLGPCQGLATAGMSPVAWAPCGKAASAPGTAPGLAPAAAPSEAGDREGADAPPRAHPKTRHGARKRTRRADGCASADTLAARGAGGLCDPNDVAGGARVHAAPSSGRLVADGAQAANPAGFQAGLPGSGKRPCGPALQLHRLFDDVPEAAAVLGSLPGGGGRGGGGADAAGEVGRGIICQHRSSTLISNPKLARAAGGVGHGMCFTLLHRHV